MDEGRRHPHGSDPSWLVTCRGALADASFDTKTKACLEVFSGSTAGATSSLAWLAWLREPFASFEALERCASRMRGTIIEIMLERLPPAVPPERARGYVRRFNALLEGLRGLASIEARTARVAALARMAEVLDEPHRRGSRVRDLIDFFYCQGSVLRHQGKPELPTLEHRIEVLQWRRVAPGVEHACIEGPTSTGPVHINLLRARQVRLSAVHLGSHGPTLAQLATRRDACAAISGGFTLCSQMDMEAPSQLADPVGLLVAEGEVLSPPVFRRASLVQSAGGPPRIETIGPVGLQIELEGHRFTVARCNDGEPESLAEQVVAFNRVWGPRCPEHAGTSLTLLGRRVLGLTRGSARIPKAGLVVTLPPGSPLDALAPSARALLEHGELRYALESPLEAAMAAGPLLLERGRMCTAPLVTEDFVAEVPPYTFAADETCGLNLLPRMVAGLTPDGSLILAAVDGRDFLAAIGMSLDQGARLLAALGCVSGLNLDGGDSKRMLVGSKLVDQPGRQLEWERSHPPPGAGPPADPIRPVYSALLLTPDPPQNAN